MDTITPHHIALWRHRQDESLKLAVYTSEALYTADMMLAGKLISVPWDRAHTITRWMRAANWLTEDERAHAIRQATDLLAVYDITPEEA